MSVWHVTENSLVIKSLESDKHLSLNVELDLCLIYSTVQKSENLHMSMVCKVSLKILRKLDKKSTKEEVAGLKRYLQQMRNGEKSSKDLTRLSDFDPSYFPTPSQKCLTTITICQWLIKISVWMIIINHGLAFLEGTVQLHQHSQHKHWTYNALSQQEAIFLPADCVSI